MTIITFNEIVRRTEKAIQISTAVDTKGGSIRLVNVWMPLSQIQIDEETKTLAAAEWLFEAKVRDGYDFTTLRQDGKPVSIIGRTWFVAA